GGAGGGVEVIVQLLDVLAVVALGVGEAEEPFLEDGVAAVPQGEGEAEPALAVADAQQPVLAPAVGPATGMVVGERPPAVAGGGVILADGAPLALGQVGPPKLPGAAALGQPGAFGAGRHTVHGTPWEPAGYSRRGLRPRAQASRMGSTTRQDSSASSSRMDRVLSP